MTKHKHIWTSEEEQALYAGVEKYGTGKWKKILKDPRYSAILVDRSNVNLKDKWRSLHAALNGSRSRKVKTLTTGKTTNHRLASPVPLAVISPIEYGGDSRTEYGGGYIDYGGGSPIKYGGNSHIEYGGGSHIEYGGSSRNKKPPPTYKEMIVEALASTEDPNGNGLNVDAICYSIEQKYELPGTFRRSVTSKLRRLVLSGVLEKAGDCYKFKDNHNKEDAKPAAAAAETEEKIASTAANLVVEAENKRLAAIKACEKVNKLAELLEESKAMLKMAEEIYEQCKRTGHVLLVN